MKPIHYPKDSCRGLMRPFPILTFFLLFFLSALGLQANTINGRVFNDESGASLPGAEVTILELNRSTSTDSVGKYQFSNLPSAEYTVSVNYLGFENKRMTVNVPSSGQVELDIRMTSSAGIEVLEAFEITGFREGRELALQQKRSAPNMKDIISADSIGNLPDENVADAISRLPGVALDMEQGEGRFVSIRGLSPELNNVTINGNNIASPSVGGRSGRATPLDVIGSSQVRSLEVIKAPTPDMDAQGLGGTVNLITASGFDREDSYITGSVLYGTNQRVGASNQTNRPEQKYDITFGNQFGDQNQFAVALSASYETRPYQTREMDFRYTDFFDVDRNADGTFEDEELLPRSIQITPQFGTRNRFNLSGKFEYKPDRDTHFWIEGIYSEFSEWLDEIEDIFAPDDREATFVGPTTAFVPNVDEVQLRRFREKSVQEMRNITIGGRKKWGNLSVEAELTFAVQENTVDGKNLQFRGRDDEFSVFPGQDPIDTINGIPIPDSLCAGGALPGVCEEGETIPFLIVDIGTGNPKYTMGGIENTDLFRIPHRRNQLNIDFSEEETFIPKIDFQWDFDDFLGGPGYFKVGAKYFDRNRLVDDDVYRTGNVSATLADIPNAMRSGRDIFGHQTGLEIDWDAVFNDFFGGEEGIRNLPASQTDILANNVEDSYDFTEKILGLYGMVELNLNQNLTIIAGFRYEDTDVDMIASQFTEAEFLPGTDLDSLCDGGFTDEGCVSTVNAEYSFENLLPNLQFRYEVNDNFIVRAAYTGTIGRPNFEDASPISALEWEFDGTDLEAEAGLRNPRLEPYEADNFDLGFEWFLDNGMVFAAALFHKRVDNPIYAFSFSEENITVAQAQQIAVDRTGSPLNIVGLDSTQVITEIEFEGIDNAESGEITGLEIQAYMPLLFLPDPFNGLGIDANATFIESDVDVIGRETEGLPFFDQADFLANVAIFYQRGPFEGRIAMRHQSTKLDELQGFFEADLWSDEQTQFDAQMSYVLNENLTLFLNARNITNERDDVIHGDNSLTPQYFEDFGSTYQLGLRFNY